MTTLSTEDNTRPGADDRHPDGFNPVIEVMENPGNTSLHRVSGSLSNSHVKRGPSAGVYDGGLSSARGSREFFRDLGDLDYQNRHRPVATVEPLL